MSDEIEAVTEGAKAVQEVAKTGRAVVEAGSLFSRFVAKALGTAPEDVVGLAFGDYLKELRIRNADRLARATEEILRDRGVKEPKLIEPKVLIPALEAASETSDETLQGMWVNLLANAMDPTRNVSPRRVFTDTLKEFEPLDAAILLYMGKLLTSEKAKRKEYTFDQDGLAKRLKVRPTEIDISVENLVKLECIRKQDVTMSRVRIMGSPNLTSLGIELYLACADDAPD